MQKMTDNTPAISQSGLPASPQDQAKIQQFNNNGNGTLIGSLNAQNVHIALTDEQLEKFFPLLGAVTTSPDNTLEISQLDRTHYNLFVLENEDFRDGAFCVGKSDALTYSPGFSSNQPITADFIESVKKYPCIFAARNSDRNTTNSDQPFMIGKIMEVAVQGNNIKFKFKKYQTIVQQNILNESPQEFALATASLRNELDMKNHWAIKDLDLLGILESKGYKIS
ncbi:MAG: hypothetical protein LIV24_00300 [Eubacterium sp.]|nr:hypothetical protein [Eubacterium sp.]